MGSSSIYAIDQSVPAKWRAGEDLAAIGFVATTFYLFFDISFSIHRVFKRKQGLYFWCMLLGTWGCFFNAIAIILKHFIPDSQPLWPLYTLLILGGWTVYCPAQLLVLYSRLHLVNQNRKIGRYILIMIVTVSVLIIIPTWVLAWQSYNPYDSHLSSTYSPREAAIDRVSQILYTVTEGIVSGVYILSLTKLLRLKASVKQRRVMTDLIAVNVVAVVLDVLTVVLVFLNRTGISHPIQAFSYILKLKLEFVVLNQLMAVAARGMQKESFAERRYHHPSTSSASGKDSLSASNKTPRWELESLQKIPEKGSATELMPPSPTLSKSQPPGGMGSNDMAGFKKWPEKVKFKKHSASRAGKNDAEDEDEDIGVHLWERNGKLVMEVPWFKREGKV